MSEGERPTLEDRVNRLERLVEEFISRRRPDPPAEAETPRPARPSRPSQRPRPDLDPYSGSRAIGHRLQEWLSGPGQSERWLGRIGVGFVVLATAFLLKLSFDRGWITPGLRLGAGFGAGALFLFLGWRLDPARRVLVQALSGGAIALFYLTGFAGFQLYHLLPFWVAISLMTATTLLSIVLSERQDSPILSMTGVAGGLATPFLLDTGSGDVNALAIYVSLVLAGGGAVLLHRGWVPLLGTLLVGGSGVLAVVAFGAGVDAALFPTLAIVIFWLVGGFFPILGPMVSPEARRPRNRLLHLWSVRTALGWSTILAAILLGVVFDLEGPGVAWIFFIFGALTGVSSYLFRRFPPSHWSSAEISAVCIALGWALAASESTIFLLLLIQAFALIFLASRGAPQGLAAIGHVLAGIAAVGFLSFAGDAELGGFLGLREGALVRLGMLPVSVAISWWVGADLAPRYRGGAYIGLLIWFLSEFAPKPYGAQVVSIAWSIQGAAALVMSTRSGSQTLQLVGLATLGLVAAKLLLFDLSQLDPGWRILMFFGFGIVLLGLAYLVNRPGKGEEV
jgi:uncharacterized membrane protein